MIDIFPSARESATLASQVSSDQLCAAINDQFPTLIAKNVHTIPQLAQWCDDNLHLEDIFLCLGAGDIYHFWDLLQ